MWQVTTGGSDHHAELSVDQSKMQAVLDELDAGIKTPPIEGTIVFRDGGANATPYGVLIKAWVRKSALAREGAATVAMFSTRHWKITASKGLRTNDPAPGTRYSQEANCEEFSGTSASASTSSGSFATRILARCSARRSSTPTTSPATT